MATRNQPPNIGPTEQVSAKTAGVMAGDRVPPGSDPRMHAGDALPPDAPNAGETLCSKCGGSGRLEGQTCPECEGSGRVIESVAGGP